MRCSTLSAMYGVMLVRRVAVPLAVHRLSSRSPHRHPVRCPGRYALFAAWGAESSLRLP